MAHTINTVSALAHIDITNQAQAAECREAMTRDGWAWGNGEPVSTLERLAIEALAEGHGEMHLNTAQLIADARVNGLI